MREYSDEKKYILKSIIKYQSAIALIAALTVVMAGCGKTSAIPESNKNAAETVEDNSLEEEQSEAVITMTQDKSEEQQADSKKNIVICIDPGHGGSNEGAKETYDGNLILEKNINLKIASTLKSYLEQYDGVKVVMTRYGDNDVSFSGRVKCAVNNDADYMISVHTNSKSTEEVDSSGCLAIMSCSRYQSAKSKKAGNYETEKQLASSIISRLNGIGIKIANDWDVENTGGILQRTCTNGETYPDGSPADYYSLIYEGTYAGIPTVIIENAYLSNENDYRNFLCTDEKLNAIARADANGIADALSLIR